MATINQYFPQTVSHPGNTLEEKLQEMGMSIKEFALRTDKPEKTIIAIIKGVSAITQEMAIKFENVTQIPANFWIKHQQRYDEIKTREKLKCVVIEAGQWTNEFPYAEMAANKWVKPTRIAEEKTINLLSYFGVASHQAWGKLYIESELKVAAYTSLKQSHEPHAISAWLRQGELQAKQMVNAPNFDVKILKAKIPFMRKLMVDQPKNYFEQLQQLCFEAGVLLLFTPKLPKVTLSGSTRWLNNTPLIQMNEQYNKYNSFWLTFFHELGHIILHGKKYISLENIDFAAADNEKEEEAQQFALAHIFPNEKENELINKK